MAQNNQGCLRDSIWQFVGTVIALLALLFSIFVWFVPNRSQLFSSTPVNSTSTVTSTPTATTFPSSIPTVVTQPSPTQSASWFDVLLAVLEQTCFTGIIIGVITGFLVSILFRRGAYGIVGDVVVGIVGAFIGGTLAEFFTHTALLWITIVAALIGSMIMIFFLRLISWQPRTI